MMEDLFEVLKVLITIGWVAFALFGSKIFKRKGKQQQSYEQPERVERPVPQGDEDIAQEERKLKEWLENVFGGGSKKQEPDLADDYYDEDEAEEEELVLLPKPASAYYSSAEQSPSKPELSVPAPAVKVQAAANKQHKSKFGGSQMAYGFVMSEVFQKPRALRPFGVRGKKSL